MMKITNPEGIQQARTEKAHSKKDPLGAANFSYALSEALKKPDLTEGAQETFRLSEPRSIQNLGKANLQTDYVDKTSRVIDLMDAYANSLSNPQKTLNDIEPELTTFIEEARNLHDKYANSENATPELKNIIEDLLRTARLEAARFQRGDYLDSE
jgi:hypothetical protein